MKLRIYPKHIQKYESFFDTLPEKVKKGITFILDGLYDHEAGKKLFGVMEMKTIGQKALNVLIEKHNEYLRTLIDTDKGGERLFLDNIDFTKNDLSELDFVDTYIASSFFSSQVFRNVNFGDAKLYSCIFKNMVFVDCNFGKTVLEYARIVGSKFINCNLIQLETLESSFEDVFFYDCVLDGAFSDCSLKDAVFEKCTFNSTEFWKCSLENMKFLNRDDQWDLKKIIQEINIGTDTNPIFIKGSEAVKYFESKCMML